MSNPPTRPAYVGTKPLLAIAIDVGTTFSGASYTFLRPNQIPKIYNVSRYEGQEDISGSSKVPSVLYYDSDGTLLSCGPQANNQAETEGGIRVEWFKLLLRPASINLSLEDAPLIQVPPGSNAVRIFGDFLNYMRSCVQKDMCDRFVEGKESWDSMHSSARYILSHPNGWEGMQQGQMREAAIKGGLVPDTPEGRERIEFVTEGEASFHWCVDMELANAALALNSQIVIADAGGGTIDVSSFRVTSLKPLRLQENSIAACEVVGSVFVTHRFKNAIREKLSGSEFGEDEHIEALAEVFDKTTKRLFRTADKPTYVKMGSRRYNDIDYNIRSGQLTVPGDLIAATFEPSVAATANAIRNQIKGVTNAHVFLTGGFGASPWLYGELQRRLADVMQNLKNDDSNSGKAVAHGAIAYYLDHLVYERLAKHTLGVPVDHPFNENDAEHRKRRANIWVSPSSGQRLLRGGFMTIVRKGQVLTGDAQYRQDLVMTVAGSKMTSMTQLSATLHRYTGTQTDVSFFDMDRTHFQEVCKFHGTAPPNALVRKQGPQGAYAHAPYGVILNLGKTELTCNLEWKQKKGKVVKGPATSVWEDI